MPVHDDLLGTAAALAAEAKGNAQTPDAERTALLVGTVKTALEAAALAQSVGPGEIAEVLGQIQQELDDVGLLPESMTLEPVDLLRLVLGQVQGWQAEALAGRRLIEAYGSLRSTLERFERDFEAGGTETSMRLAARVHAALEDAGALVRPADDGAEAGA